MESTINFAIHNAFAKLSLSPQLADEMLTHLWRPTTPPINLDKLNRQQAQRLESMAKGEVDKHSLHKSFTAYINRLDPEVFKSISLVEHMEDFLQPPAPAPEIPAEDEDEELVEVNYHLRMYDVGIKTHRVYEFRHDVHVFVGMLGMNEFKDMIMPEYE
jgi:hypothetical protein